jgi:uncharacterized protein (TIGR02757 family)
MARSVSTARITRARRAAVRDAAIGEVLEAVRARCDLAERRASDPVEFVHAYDSVLAQELVALIASSLAFGSVSVLRAKIADALRRLGPDLPSSVDDPALVRERLRGWRHRLYRGDDLAGLVIGARRVQVHHGSLGAALERDLAEHGELRPALSAWVQRIRREGGLDGGGRGSTHILTDPMGGSAAKRLMLLLRWMCRPADGVDLGLWKVSPARLLVPVDTHIHKLGRNLGFTKRQTVSWRAAEEITAALRAFDPMDPVKFDFSLCHLGMVQQCPSRRDVQRCEGCGVRSVCMHWTYT